MVKEIIFGVILVTAWIIYRSTKGIRHSYPDQKEREFIWKNTFADQTHHAFNSRINL